jgi:hypothetical protein
MRITFATSDGPVTVDLESVPDEAFDRIAESDPDGDTWDCFVNPGRSFERACAVLDAAADHAGIERVVRPSDPSEREALMRMFDG